MPHARLPLPAPKLWVGVRLDEHHVHLAVCPHPSGLGVCDVWTSLSCVAWQELLADCMAHLSR